jgi:hypothetical protein
MGKERDAYVEKLKMKIDEYNAEIDRLQTGAHEAQVTGVASYQKYLLELKAKHLVLKEKMVELHHAGEGAWEDVKTGVDTAWKTLEESLKAAKSKFD